MGLFRKKDPPPPRVAAAGGFAGGANRRFYRHVGRFRNLALACLAKSIGGVLPTLKTSVRDWRFSEAQWA